MFSSCISQSNIDLLVLIITNVIDESYMFSDCSTLKSIQTYQSNNIDISSIINIKYLFSRYTLLELFDLSLFLFKIWNEYFILFLLETVGAKAESIKNIYFLFHNYSIVLLYQYICYIWILQM